MITTCKSDRLISICKKHIGNCNYKYKLCAIIFDKNKILSIGVNSTKSYPFVKRFFLHGTIHAEIAATIQLLHYDNLKNLSLFVMRLAPTGEIKYAKPCPMCIQALYSIGMVKDVFWTTNHNTIEFGKLDVLYNEVMKMDKNLRLHMNGKLPKS